MNFCIKKSLPFNSIFSVNYWLYWIIFYFETISLQSFVMVILSHYFFSCSIILEHSVILLSPVPLHSAAWICPFEQLVKTSEIKTINNFFISYSRKIIKFRFTKFIKSLILFNNLSLPLNCSWWFRGDIKQYPINPFDLINDFIACFGKEFFFEVREVSSHPVGATYRS